MKTLLLLIFTWWNRQTAGTWFYTWRKGERVGEDEYGNVYYRAKNAGPLGERRWVVFSGVAEASAIPASWHGWMHHRTDRTPDEEKRAPFPWEKPHRQNLTGTAGAYRPAGSILNTRPRAEGDGDYEAWTPGT
ncbi:NADH:ubiquinone oxidoreductase subunit NDUFA12 [Rhodobium gokarnense]|uniref:NADH:ubiquinone oxidoreductase subunit n=1 Tax=Rhodobium gokarnense TaxID=364296 RepID=A0ABT3HAH4_9HYPH|nr:NADH:ubiquinone oxidoreductase subunit NDUFA12 [Rhodobium gokarnense]MCW2307407.1 NADH:ubiquinone oxidoreductase subunit [Rhodobium gokarnense]